MSQKNSSQNIINWELVAVNPNNKNWSWTDLFYFWGVNVQSVIGFSLIASLYTIYSLNFPFPSKQNWISPWIAFQEAGYDNLL